MTLRLARDRSLTNEIISYGTLIFQKLNAALIRKEKNVATQLIDIDKHYLTVIDGLDKHSLFKHLINYMAYKVRIDNLFANDSSYQLSSDHSDSTIMHYHSVSEYILGHKMLYEALLPLATKENYSRYKKLLELRFSSIEVFNIFLKKEKHTIEEKLAYCSLRIKSQLVFNYLQLKVIPKYLVHEGKLLPLFEQNREIVAEKDDFITLGIYKDNRGYIYLTGFKNSTPRSAFIAKVVDEQVAWFKLTTLQEDSLNAYGHHIEVDEKSDKCAMAMKIYNQYQFSYRIYTYDAKGSMITEIDSIEQLPVSISFVENGAICVVTSAEHFISEIFKIGEDGVRIAAIQLNTLGTLTTSLVDNSSIYMGINKISSSTDSVFSTTGPASATAITDRQTPSAEAIIVKYDFLKGEIKKIEFALIENTLSRNSKKQRKAISLLLDSRVHII